MAFKANIPTPVGTFQIEGQTQADMFQSIADIQEMCSDKTCGLCNSSSIRYEVREVKGDRYFEIHCTECGATLKFGQRKEPKGSLFAQRKLDDNGKPDWRDGRHGAHRGWTKWRGGDSSQQQAGRRDDHDANF